MAKCRDKAAKIRALLAETPTPLQWKSSRPWPPRRVRVSPAQVYGIKSTMTKPKADDYASLIQAKRLADARLAPTA
jgi:hypothetical protein